MGLVTGAGTELQASHTTAEPHLTPSASIRARRPRTTVASLKVPMGSMQRQDLFAGATRHQLLQHLAAVVLGIAHLAVELAIGEGAGPSPNWALDSGLKGLVPCQKPKVCRVRCFTDSPRSSNSGRKPIRANSKAAK